MQGHTEGHTGICISGIQLHGPLQQLAGFLQPAEVAVDDAQVGEAMEVVGLQPQGGFQQGDGFLVAAGLQVLGDGFTGGALI